MRKCISIILFLIIFFGSPVYANKRITSFNNPNLTKDTAQVFKFIQNIKKSFKKITDSVLFLPEENLKKDIALTDEEKQIKLIFDKALSYFFKGEYETALVNFNRVINLAEKTDEKFYLNSSKIYIGTVYMFYANYNLALNFTLEGLAYFEEIKDYKSVAGIYLNLTFIQIEQDDIDEAADYAKKAYEYTLISGNKKYLSKTLLNLGEIQFLRGNLLNALTYYKRSLREAQKIGYKNFYSTIYLNTGSTFFELNQLDSAELYLQKVIDTRLISTDVSSFIIPKAYLLMSDVFKKRNMYRDAIMYSEEALNFADSSKSIETVGTAYEYLSDIYFELNDFKRAYDYKILSVNIKDSIFDADKYRIQNQLEAVYHNNLKQKIIDNLTSENEINKLKSERFKLLLYLSVFIVLVAITFALLLIRQNKIRNFHKTIELEQKLLRSQMNPHFIFNSLSSVQDFILSNNPLEATAYLSDFSKLMRAVLTCSSSDSVSLRRELETIESYLKLQALRFSGKLSYKIEVSDEADIDEIYIPPMLLQPFTENSVVHGISEKNGGLIVIRVRVENNFLILENEDNGIGRKAAEKSKSETYISKATEITDRRIELLREKYKQNIRYSITDLFDNEGYPSGTLVRFKLFPVV